MHLETKVLKNGKVFYRIMPQENMKWEYVKLLDDRKTIFMRYLQELSTPVETPSFWTFKSDYVFWNNAQEDVYQTVMDGVLERVLGGTSAIITAFGQTGTGKSLTTNGLNCLYKDRGMLPRIITDIFQAKAAQEMNNIKVCMQISYVEISRQVLVDLLKPYPNITDAIKNVKKVKVEDEEQVLRYLFIGEGRKEFVSNDPYLSNAASSIFTFCITTRDVKMYNTPNVVSYLHVIDLAGADTVGNTSCLFKQPQDIGTGNLAKTQLEQFLLILNEDIPDVIKVKYRLNTMIQYLGDALSNKSVLHFIGHIKIAREDLSVTISMLRFGQIILGLKPKMNDTPNSKKDMDCPEKLRLIQNELDQLKRDNKFNAILENNKGLSMGISADRYGHIERTVTEYAQDKINEIELIQVADVNVALEVFKKKLKVAEDENKRQSSALSAALKQKVSGSIKV